MSLSCQTVLKAPSMSLAKMEDGVPCFPGGRQPFLRGRHEAYEGVCRCTVGTRGHLFCSESPDGFCYVAKATGDDLLHSFLKAAQESDGSIGLCLVFFSLS